MSIPIPADMHFCIKHEVLDSCYTMPIMEASDDYFEIGYVVSGDRLIITPTCSCALHAGYVGTIPPFIYHRTLPSSDSPYERYLIKFRPDFIKPLTDALGRNVLDEIYSMLFNRFTPEEEKRIFMYFQEISALYASDSCYSHLRIQHMLCNLLLAVLDCRLPSDTDNIVHKTPLTPSVIDAIYYMEQHYHENPSLETVALLSGYSVSHFSRLFHTQLGKSYSDYLAGIRLRHVQDLLLNTKKSVTEIALETGYLHPGNLSGQFRRLTGLTPLQYRKSHICKT